MISDKYKCIFVHIIRSGGRSISRALPADVRKRYGLGPHARSSMFVARLGSRVWKSYFTFSFVRNPWDKMVSQYAYNHDRFVPYGTTFKDYLRMFEAGEKISSLNPVQSPWICNRRGKLLVDFVGRFESIRSDYRKVCLKIGFRPKNLRHVGKSKHRHYTEYYDDETISIIEKCFERDIKMFGYSYGG